MSEIARSLLRNSALAFVAKVVSQLANAFLFVLVARQYGAEEAGVYALAIKYSVLSLALATGGLDGLLIRQVAADRSTTIQYLVNHGLLRLVGGTIAYLILALIVGSAMGYSVHTIRVILWLALGIIPEGMNRLAQAIFMAHERFIYPAVIALIVSGVRFSVGGFLIWARSGLEILVALQVCTSLLGLGMYAGLLRRWLSEFAVMPRLQHSVLDTSWRQQLDWGFLRRQLGLSLPFALMEIFLTVEWQIDVILLSLFLPEREVGFYGAAQTVVSFLSFALFAYHAAAYPLMTRLYVDDRPRLWQLYCRLFLYVGMAILPVATATVGLTPTVIAAVYGPRFGPAAIALQWLIWSMVVNFLDEPNSRLIIIAGHQKTVAAFLGLSMALNIVLNILLIPRYGIVASAWARLLSVICFSLANGVFVYNRISHINPLPILGKLFLATVAMGGTLYVCHSTGTWLGMVLGGTVYLLMLVLTRAVPAEDWRRLRETSCRYWERLRMPEQG
jgi:O-antigen/teichoic acid export membrane protein